MMAKDYDALLNKWCIYSPLVGTHPSYRVYVSEIHGWFAIVKFYVNVYSFYGFTTIVRTRLKPLWRLEDYHG